MIRLKKMRSIKVQIFLAGLAITMFMAAIFSPYGCYTNIHSIRTSIDERLKTSIYGVKSFLPENFVDRMIKRQVPSEKYKLACDILFDYCKKADISYIYILTQDESGNVFFLLDDKIPPFTKYTKVSNGILEAFNTLKPVIEQGYDEEFETNQRSVLVPFKSSEGRTYVIGADIEVSYIRPIILKSLKDFLFLMLIGIILVILLTFIIARRISRPIIVLSDFTKELSKNNFDKKIKIKKSKRISLTTESALLYRNILFMRRKLFEYIAETKSAIAAKEKAESELKIAGQIQKSFLPDSFENSCNLDIYADMKPAKEAGGDLYDMLTLNDGRLCLAIGDVSGKGMPAALFMSRAITAIHSASAVTSSLPEIASSINKELCRNNPLCTFLTLQLLAFNPNDDTFSILNCGHNPPLISNSDSSEFLNLNPNSVLGVFDEIQFKEQYFKLHNNQQLLLYTDGITEAINIDGLFFGEKQTIKLALESFRKKSSRDAVNCILQTLQNFQGKAPQADDITLIIVRQQSDLKNIDK